MLNNVNNILSVFNAFVCLILAFYLTFTNLFLEQLHGTKRTVFIVILLLYSAYRIFRLVKSIRDERTKKQF